MKTADAKGPKYRQVKEAIVKAIRDEQFQADQRLPSIRELMSLHRVSYATITRALDDLQTMGLVEHRWGKGIFLREIQKAVKNIAISFDDVFKPTDPHIVQILQGISREIARTDWHMQFYPLPISALFQGSDQSLLAALLEEKRIDALIAVSPHPPEDIERLQDMCVPTVSILNEYPGSGAGCVMPDVADGAQQVVHHLVDQRGHKNIYLVLGPEYKYSARLVRSSTAMGQAMVFELRRRDLRCPSKSIFFSDYSWRSVEAMLRQWLSSKQRPDAIVLADPFLAEDALRLAQEMGLRVPEDLSIVGWGGGKHLPNSQVSSVVLPLDEVGATAVSMLHRMFAGDPATVERLPVRLVLKDSVNSVEVSSPASAQHL